MPRTLGERLRSARENKGFTQVYVKNRTGINNKTISGYENGVSEPDMQTLLILADLYEVTVDWLYGRDNIDMKSLSEQDIKLINGFHSLDKDDRDYILKFIDKLKKGG